MRSVRTSRGFTLFEVVIVIGIIAIAAAIGLWKMGVQRQRVTVHQIAQRFRTRLEHARTLAMAAGSRLGVMTPMQLFQNCGAGGPDLVFSVDPATQTYTVPVALEFDGTPSNVMVSNCDTISVATESDGRARIAVPTGPMQLEFAPNGRLENAPPGGAFIRFERVEYDSTTPETNLGPGIRVLPSGVICASSNEVGPPFCDES